MEEHDASYRKLFSTPQMVKDLLEGYIKESWVNELNFDVMEAVETSFVSEGLRKREADIIWRIQWRKRWLYIYVLIEMQSTIDPTMAIRLLTYTGLLYQDIINRKQLTASGRLPPILPITLYNGATTWSAAKTLTELIEPTPKSLQRYQPQFEYFLLDQNQTEKSATKPNFVEALISLETSNNSQKLEEGVAQLSHWINVDNPEHRKLAKIFTVWLTRSLLPARFPGVKLPKLQNLLEVKNMLAENVKEWTQDWKQEGIEAGRKEGMKKGIEAGRKKGIEAGRKKGMKEGLQLVVVNMLAEGMSADSIHRVTGLSLKEIAAITAENAQ